MNKPKINLGKLFGINISIDRSWFIILAITLYSFYFANRVLVPYQTFFFYSAVALLQTIVFNMSIILHELGHAIVARKHGIPIDSITLFMLGGVSNISREPEKPITELKMSFSGPLVSLIIGTIFVLISMVPVSNNFIIVPVFGILGYLNLFMGIFNLLPGFPLDGGRILRSFIWAKTKDLTIATKIATNFGKFVGGALVILGVIEFILNMTLSGPWLIIIGFFIYQSAKSSMRQYLLLAKLEKIRVGDFFERNVIWADPDELTSEVMRRMMLMHTKIALTKSGEKVIGIFYFTPKAQLDSMIKQVAYSVKTLCHVSANDPMKKALEGITRSNCLAIPVLENGEIVGAISFDDIDFALAVR